jgi:transcriptional regulator with XRE-family HTH domain
MEETLGKRIMQHRKNIGMTQDQLAERLGVTAQAVSKWENDLSCPDINTLPKLAELFGTSTDALLGREPVYDGQVVPEKEDEEEKDSGWEFHWDAGRKGAFTSAIFVLLVGGLLFVARYLGWDVGFWGIAWPSALLVYGLSALLRRFNSTNVVCTLLGGYFLVDNLGIVEISLDKNLIFPGLILILGLSLLIDALRKPKGSRFHIHKKGDISHKTKGHFTQEDEHFACDLHFGEVTHRITLPRLREGKASVSFGEMTLDLRDCGQIMDGCELDISVSFGELRLLVPRCYRVECCNGTSFGDISTHGHPDSDARGVIRLEGSVSFGELEVHYV